jgi:hypothetical protein
MTGKGIKSKDKEQSSKESMLAMSKKVHESRTTAVAST